LNISEIKAKNRGDEKPINEKLRKRGSQDPYWSRYKNKEREKTIFQYVIPNVNTSHYLNKHKFIIRLDS